MNKTWIWVILIGGVGLYLYNKEHASQAAAATAAAQGYSTNLQANIPQSSVNLPPATGLPLLMNPTPVDQKAVGNAYQGFGSTLDTDYDDMYKHFAVGYKL